jgi:hypothetical protein
LLWFQSAQYAFGASSALAERETVKFSGIGYHRHFLRLFAGVVHFAFEHVLHMLSRVSSWPTACDLTVEIPDRVRKLLARGVDSFSCRPL